MTTILHIDSSARLGRSHSRRLSARFVEAWLARRPRDTVIRRDVGLEPPPSPNPIAGPPRCGPPWRSATRWWTSWSAPT